MKGFPELCTPAMVYLGISVVGLLFYAAARATAVTMLVKMMFVALWTWFLNYLCSKGLGGVSWFLVIVPWVFLLAISLVVVDTIESKKHNQQHDQVKHEQHRERHHGQQQQQFHHR